MKLYVHTSGRSGLALPTLNALIPLRSRTSVVVQKREEQHYRSRLGRDWNLVVLPDHICRLSPTRQWILEEAHKNKEEKICLFDDDLHFFHRTSKKDWHLKKNTDEDMVEMVDLLDSWLNEIIHCSISHRFGNESVRAEHISPGRAMQVLAYRTHDVISLGARFDRIQAKQDMDMTLQLLRAGYTNRISFTFCHDQIRSTNDPKHGGCAEYRTAFMMDESVHELARLHPGLVRVRKPVSAAAKKRGVALEVIVDWKKALASSTRGRFF